MRCPLCNCANVRAIRTRGVQHANKVVRTRECRRCKRRFRTIELFDRKDRNFGKLAHERMAQGNPAYLKQYQGGKRPARMPRKLRKALDVKEEAEQLERDKQPRTIVGLIEFPKVDS